MIPENQYSVFFPKTYSDKVVNQYMDSLADDWFDASANKLSSNETGTLYDKTENAYTYLNQLKNRSHLEQGKDYLLTISKMVAFSDAFINRFNKHSPSESKILAQWIIEHTGQDNGAYNSLHKLVELMKSIKSKEWNDKNQLAQVINEASKVGSRVPMPDNTDVKAAIFSQLDIKSLLALRSTSKENKYLVNTILIEALNGEKITFGDLGINYFYDIMDFFEERSSELVNLWLNIKADDTSEKIAQIIQWCPNIPRVCITKDVKVDEGFLKNLSSLTRLHSLSFNQFNDAEAFNSIINCCPHLKYVTLEGFDTIEDISILDSCTELKELCLTNCPNIKDVTMVNCPLRSLEVEACPIKKIDCAGLNDLKSTNCPVESVACPALQKIWFSDCVIAYNDILKNLIALRIFILSNCDTDQIDLQHNPRLEEVAISNCQFTSLYFLKNLAKIKAITIQDCPIHFIDDVKSLPLLEDVEIYDCPDVTDLNVLLDCAALKTVTMPPTLPSPTEDLSVQDELDALTAYHTLLKALEAKGVELKYYA